MTIDRDPIQSFAEAMGKIPSGLFIITYFCGDTESAMLASWVQQCGFDPPMLSVAVKKGRGISEWLTDGVPFTVNILGETQKDLLSHFGKGLPLNQLPNAEKRIARVSGFAPVLIEATAVLRCCVAGHFTPSDHQLFFGTIVGGVVNTEEEPWVHIRKNGLNY